MGMQYMGGKAKIARRVVAAILADTDARDIWYEPFVGGGNVMEHAAPYFRQSVGSDIHPDLIMLWEHVATGNLVPEFVSRERYQELRHAPSSWERGYAGFGASFGGKWFGGYGVSPRDGEVCRASFRSVSRQQGVFMKYGTRFTCGPFGRFVPPPGSVVYCDPPYAGTTAYASTGSFDYVSFYATLREWARDRHVYLSEYAIPADVSAKVIWEREKRNVLERGDNQRITIEKLFRILPD
jgi:DNA adenine methylase